MRLIYFLGVPILFAVVAGFVRFRYLSPAFKWLQLFLVYALFNESFALFLIRVVKVSSTMPLVSIYCFFQYVLLGLFYKKLLNGKLPNRLIDISIAIVFLTFVVNVLFNGIWQYPSVPEAVELFLILGLIIFYFYTVMQEAVITKLSEDAAVLVNLGFLIYFSAKLFYTLMFNVILQYSMDFLLTAATMFTLLNYIFYIYIGVVFLRYIPKRTC